MLGVHGREAVELLPALGGGKQKDKYVEENPKTGRRASSTGKEGKKMRVTRREFERLSARGALRSCPCVCVCTWSHTFLLHGGN